MPARRLPLNSRKLLVAAVGVAAVSYIGCSVNEHPAAGNLMSTFPNDAGQEAGQFPTSGNLMAPDPDAGVRDAADDGADDASDAADAGDADDAADAHD